MGLNFSTRGGDLAPSGEPPRGKLLVVRSVRWSRQGFEFVCREARAQGQDPAAYVRRAALAQAARDAAARQRKIQSRRPPFEGEGGGE